MNVTRRRWIARLTLTLGMCGACLPAAQPVHAATDIEEQSRLLGRAQQAVLGLRAVAVEGARSIRTLGAEREGSGILIGTDGLVLTIGYLVLEAQTVELVTDDGRPWPARVVAYDVATGLGLVQALTPLALPAAPLGPSGQVRTDEPLMVVSGGRQGQVGPARLLSRRPFSGSWEYHIDQALYTAPARRDHSGAGLFNGRGELVGVGSLLLGDATSGGTPRQPGNLFVPVDLLRPVLAELRAQGRSNASRRAWLGLQCVETAEGLRVTRVTDDSPADVAGLEAGDLIERIDGQAVSALAPFWQALWSGGSPQRSIRLDIVREGVRQPVVVHSVDRQLTLKRPEGV